MAVGSLVLTSIAKRIVGFGEGFASDALTACVVVESGCGGGSERVESKAASVGVIVSLERVDDSEDVLIIALGVSVTMAE